MKYLTISIQDELKIMRDLAKSRHYIPDNKGFERTVKIEQGEPVLPLLPITLKLRS